MLAEEETELRDLIIQNLEKCGFLNKIKAELRAGVCLALEEETDFKTKIPLLNSKLSDFVDTPEGKLVVSVVREFLEYFGLNFTLSVFDPEVSCKSPYFSRSQLCDRLKLSVTENEPVISNLLKPSHASNPKDFSDITSRDADFMRTKSTDVTASQRYISENIPIVEESFSSATLKDLTVSNAVDEQFSKNKKSEGVLGLINEKTNQDETLLFRGDKAKENDLFSKVGSSKLQKSNFKVDNIFSKSKSDSPLDETKDILSDITHDSFFDEPLPTAKPAYFSYAEGIVGANLKDNSKTNIFKDKNNQFGADNNSLTSLKDLPSLTTKEWSFSKDPKNMHPSLDSLKSVSSSENSNEEVINLDEDVKKDADVTESNEDTSEKQLNSEESIEEDLEEDASTGLDDLLNSSLSLADDATTDQTVSQISIVHGVDHVEPCNSLS